MADRPSIFLVHGFCGGAAHWAEVITEPHRRGYGSVASQPGPVTDLIEEAAAG